MGFLCVLFLFMADKLRKINCIAKRGARRCGNYLGDMLAEVDGKTTFRPCQQCHISWEVTLNNNLLTYREISKDEVKDYDEDTLITEDVPDALR